MKKIKLLISLLFISGTMMAQTITPVASGLVGPAGICKGMNGHLIVAESGSGQNDGRVSMVDTTGLVQTVVFGLPSFLDTASGETSGPWKTYMMPDTMLMVLVGKGPDTLGGVDSVAGSILLFDMTGFTPGTDSMDIADAVKIIHVQQWVYANGFFDSNIFGAYYDSLSNNLYVVDAGANAILKIDGSANISVLDTFPAIANPGPGFPPFIDYVPTDVVGSNGSLYVCNLSGFPFMHGLSEITMVDTAGFSHTNQAMGLSQSVDMEMDSANNFYVLQFGNFDTTTFAPIMNSASLLRVMTSGQIDTLATGFGPSAGLTSDWGNGFYVTELMTGMVLHITNIQTSAPSLNNNIVHSLSAYPNPFDNSIKINYSLNEKSKVTYTITDQIGKVVFTTHADELQKGAQSFEINSKLFDLSSLKSGMYYLTVNSGISKQTINILKN